MSLKAQVFDFHFQLQGLSEHRRSDVVGDNFSVQDEKLEVEVCDLKKIFCRYVKGGSFHDWIFGSEGSQG